MVTKFSFLANTINSTNKDVRISKRLRVPSNRLRGFESGKVGPKDSGEFIGGNYVSTLNISTNIPQLLPNSESLAFNLFFDVANVWSVDYDSKIDQSNTIRSSAGIAIDIYTPIGPLAISFAQPITKSKTDILESFRFNIGTNF
jgi:outer membrane protein insertion porin family